MQAPTWPFSAPLAPTHCKFLSLVTVVSNPFNGIRVPQSFATFLKNADAADEEEEDEAVAADPLRSGLPDSGVPVCVVYGTEYGFSKEIAQKLCMRLKVSPVPQHEARHRLPLCELQPLTTLLDPPRPLMASVRDQTLRPWQGAADLDYSACLCNPEAAATLH